MSKKFSLSKSYEPTESEAPIYRMWLDSGVFHATPDERPPERRYVIMMPLPNVTGALHMGHAMDNSMQDVLIRWHRMLGDNTLWMPGTDHAGIATQAVVEKRLKELEGITRHDVGREGLVERIWAWKDQYQARIISQLQRVGCSCDWERQRFTMDRVCSRAVRHTFFRMFEDGLIFRGQRLVNWDPYLRTSISDDEVYHETVQGFFWTLRYPVMDPLPGEPEYVEVATTRPETMLGDTAVAVHPDPAKALREEMAALDEEIKQCSGREKAELAAEHERLAARERDMLPRLIQLRDMARAGRQVCLPLLDRPMPLICDDWAKPALGTGCVKITPAHDYNDYDVWTRHCEEIDIINILNEDGTLNENAGPYAGLDRYVARDKVVDDLKAQGLLTAVEDRQIEIGHSDRSKTPIEPYLSDQWFIRMGDSPAGVRMGEGTAQAFTAPGLVQAAMDAVNEGRVTFHPERFVKTYLDWLSEKRDWPISRQLWWGHRIPIWSRTVTRAELPSLLADGRLAFVYAQPTEARLRLAIPDAEYSRLVTSPIVPVDLPNSPVDAVLLDVCLIDDDEQYARPLEDAGFCRDEDVLDTWFSSSIWPFSTLGWPDAATAEVEGGAPLAGRDGYPDCLSYYYPGSCLVTARDIITLWVARMVIMGLYNLGDIPFSDVFIHANILDGKGERMSKSKGNGIDPVDIIEVYGADAMRYVLCDMQTGNQDIRLPVTAVCPQCSHHNELAETNHGRSIFTYMCAACNREFDVLGTMPDVPTAKLLSERFLEGRKFCNKLWNTARFALANLEDVPHERVMREDLALEDRWILAALNQAIRQVTAGLADYNPSAAIGAARDFMWNSLCDWYLELIKPRLREPRSPSAGLARQVLAYCLDVVLRLLQPFIPFITEHLYQQLSRQVERRGLPGLTDGAGAELLINSPWPAAVAELDDEALLATFSLLQEITTAIRDVRNSQNIPSTQGLTVTLKPPQQRMLEFSSRGHVIEHLAGVETLAVDPNAPRPRGAASVVVEDIQILVHNVIDDEAERARLLKERQRVQKEIDMFRRKLANENFVARAPAEVVEENRQRLAKYEYQMASIQTDLARLES
ncbi:MAG: valine--tRNA ligase [Acidobacteria bacterium]|nr:valine--tRNA ligase [Acidobacteriota bacterium]